MEEKYVKARRLVESDVFCHQTFLVRGLIEESNLNWFGEVKGTELDADQVNEWWLVSQTLAELLGEKEETIVVKCGNPWWGRTTTNDKLYKDKVLVEIASEPYQDPPTDPTRKTVWK